jgi:hypothetical protein
MTAPQGDRMSKRGLTTPARLAADSARSVARHPIGSTARVVGFVKGSLEAAPRLVRHVVAPPSGPDPAGAGPAAPEQWPTAPPGPRTVPKPVPDPADLPEPVVIEGEAPAAGAVHHEPKVASRDAAHGRGAGDAEERSGFVDEVALDDEPAVRPTGGRSGGTPLLDPADAAAVRAEAATLRRGADPRPG